MDKKEFWKRFGKKYEYKISKKESIVFWPKADWPKHNTQVYKFGEWEDYETIDDFIADYLDWLCEYGDLTPKFKIDDIVFWKSSYERIQWRIVAVVDRKSYIEYKIDWYTNTTASEKDLSLI